MEKRQFTPEYKAKIVLEILKEELSIGEIASRENVNRTQLQNWKKEFLENASRVFAQSKTEREAQQMIKEAAEREQEVMAKVGQLTIEVDWLKKNLLKCSDPVGRVNLVSKEDKLPVKHQCELLEVNRTSFYYKPSRPSEDESYRVERIKARLDYWHTKMPYLGVRRLVIKLREEDEIAIGRKLVKRYMAEMGIYCIFPKPNLSKRNQQHKVFPYLLRNMDIFLPNQVWAIDITYIKMGKSHMYLTAIIDWHSRFVIGWELSDSLDTAPVLEALKKAIAKYGTPAIINSDQGSQFTSTEYTSYLKEQKIRQSMDGKARWVDNVIIERWFRGLKCDNIYINEYQKPRELRQGIKACVDEYNFERPHQSLGYCYPAKVYESGFAA